MFSVSSPGKVHLTSGHIVVYGKPALLASIDLRTVSTIRAQKNQHKVEIFSSTLNLRQTLFDQEIVEKLLHAQKKWRSFSQTKNSADLKKIAQSQLDLAIYAVGQTLVYFHKNLKDVSLKIDSNIPLGANLGSSAALIASIIGSLFLYFNHNLDKEKINELTYEVEKLAHGFPSGGDNTAVVFGGLLWYRKETEFLKLFKTLDREPDDNFLIVNSGQPVETTGEMVLKVRKLFSRRPKYFQKIFSGMEECKKQFLISLYQNNSSEITKIMKKDERLLEKLGVVSLPSRLLIRNLEKLGTGVGVSGAGGQKEGSGALVVYSTDKQSVINYVQKLNLEYYNVPLGVEGLRKEKHEK